MLAGKETIPALLRQLDDREVAEMALIENLQREDLNYFEEAEGYARLIQEFQITQEEVAREMGKSQPTIANKLRLLHISERVRREISVDVITERHVRSLLKLKNEEQQLEVLNRIYKNNLNVRQTDELIENIFFKNTPLHDGAVIINENKILAARCILPVSDRRDIPGSMGLRHRAALGLSGVSDAYVVVVSEETGNITFFKDGSFKVKVSPEELKKFLSNDFSGFVVK